MFRTGIKTYCTPLVPPELEGFDFIKQDTIARKMDKKERINNTMVLFTYYEYLMHSL